MQLKEHLLCPLAQCLRVSFSLRCLVGRRFPDEVAVVVSHWNWLCRQLKFNFYPQYTKTLAAQACWAAGTGDAGLLIPAFGFSLVSVAAQETLIHTSQETLICASQEQHCRFASVCMHKCITAIIPVLSSSTKKCAVLLSVVDPKGLNRVGPTVGNIHLT